MATGNFTIYGAAKEAIAKGLIDLDTDSFVCTLHTSSYTPSVNADDTWSDVSGSQVAAGGGYSSGGVALGSVAVTRSGGTVTFDAADVSWASSTITAKYAVVTKKAGGSLASGDLLLGYLDLDTASGSSSVSTTGGTFQITWNAGGLFTMS
jgi:hypothetical protein